ncbi:MAG: ABC transporter substrate-binding protein [Lachnospiraceae bacterium]|nr:ABC transporter substrate-binding protein [Lachnospiraceae bacterium]MBP5276375.1 ABC transporter substrate-binding protein [Lachnospiraceae bacterium]
MTACDQASAKKNEELTDITFVLDWTPNTNHTGLYVALNQGYYKDLGLNVSIVQPPEDGATMMVASGKAQFGVDFQDYLAPVYTSEEKVPVEAVATIIQHNTSAIISLKEDGIESPKDLEGKNYATWSLPVEQAMMQNIMEADGGDYSKLNLIPEYVENEAAALQQDIDAIWVYYAWAGIACKQAGLDTNLIFFKDITPEFDFYSPVIIVNSDWAKENPETAKAFLKATAMGYEYAIENPDKAADILCEEVPELDKDLVKESQEWLSPQYKAEVNEWGYIDQKRWDAFYNWLYVNKLSDEIPAGYGFTNEYLPSAK